MCVCNTVLHCSTDLPYYVLYIGKCLYLTIDSMTLASVTVPYTVNRATKQHTCQVPSTKFTMPGKKPHSHHKAGLCAFVLTRREVGLLEAKQAGPVEPSEPLQQHPRPRHSSALIPGHPHCFGVNNWRRHTDRLGPLSSGGVDTTT